MNKLVTTMSTGAILVLSGGCTGDGSTDTDATGPEALPEIYINEFMASNTSTYEDNLTYPDWFELYNATAERVDLSGWWLTDQVSDPFNWQIPGGVFIEAGEYLMFFADNDEDEGDTHTGFQLDIMGGDIGLFGPNILDNPLIDSVEQYTPQFSDQSTARMPDGASTWEIDATPTPGASNN